jgi:hypothetical protein
VVEHEQGRGAPGGDSEQTIVVKVEGPGQMEATDIDERVVEQQKD